MGNGRLLRRSAAAGPGYAETLTRKQAAPEELVDRLTDEFTDRELVEATMMIGQSILLNMFNDTLKPELEEEYRKFV